MVTLSAIGSYTSARYFPALVHRDFRHLWFGMMAADSATWAAMTARAWLAKTLAQDHANAWVGLTVFAAMIPYIIVSPMAGLLADRMVRRNLLVFIVVINLVQNAALTALALAGVIELWHVILFSFINGAARAFQTPTSYPLVANLVPREHMLNAYALNASTFHASRLLGPGLIAPLMPFIDPGWIFLICTGLFALSLYLVLHIQTASTGVVERSRGLIYNLLAGLRHTYSNRLLLLIVLLIAFHCSLTMSFESLLPVISDDWYGAGGGGVAYLMMSVGAGALVASIYLAGVQDERMKGRVLFLTGVMSGVTPLALAAAPSLPVAMLATAAMGASQTAFMVITLTMMQLIVPDGIRGRITSIYIIHAAGVMAFANLGNGSLADIINPGWLLTIGGVSFTVVMVWSMFGPTLRRFYWSGAAPRASAA